MYPFGQKILVAYSTIASTTLLAIVLTGANKPQPTVFDEIRVHRIDVVEPDGTLRMVISNKNRLPPVIIKGAEHPEAGEPRPQAGMLFYNDEGSENGGLIFGGRKNEKGEVVDSGGSLSFDKYGAGQIIQLAGVDDRENRFAGLGVNDGKQRVWVGREDSGTASVALSDGDGKRRIRIQVTPEGTPSLAFYDAQGRLVQELAPSNTQTR
ncbi:MAG TPA: hypothetical protein VMS18_24950 [Candidatus Binatia bacterium]|nr:hypothetical protein [Candidatus Binatia bacterium]